MKNQLDCNLVRDVLPLYVDNILSDETKSSVESHLKTCSSCKEVYDSMTIEIEEEKPSEINDLKKYLRKTKVMYSLYGLGAIGFIAIVVSLIVDLCVNRKLTWSLIVGTSIIFLYGIIYSLVACKKNRLLKVMAVISCGTFILLFVIQGVVYYLMGMGSLWIFRYGVPITVVWCIMIWIPVLVKCFSKVNVWYCIAILLLTAILGNYFTKLIIGDFTGIQDLWSISNFISNGLGHVIGIILFLIIGTIYRKKK